MHFILYRYLKIYLTMAIIIVIEKAIQKHSRLCIEVSEVSESTAKVEKKLVGYCYCLFAVSSADVNSVSSV
jgi:hypothetical protein